MKRASLVTFFFICLLACPLAGAKAPSFYSAIGEVSIPDSATETQKKIARDAADVARDLLDAEIRKAYPCAKTTDDQDVRDKLEEERARQLAGKADEFGVEKIGNMLNVDYVSFVHVGFVGDRILVTVATFRAGNAQRAMNASALARGTSPLPSAPSEITKTLDSLVKETVSKLNIQKCPAKYYFHGNDKAGRFDIVVEGFSRDGLFGQWDVYWTATAEGGGVTSKMFVKENVLTSNEPDNLGDISGTGWVYQHMEMGDLEMESRGTITVGGTATIGGGQDDPTITLTMAKFAINTSGAGSIGNETFAQNATMSGYKGDATATGQIRGRSGRGKMDMMRPYFPEPRTYKVEKANGRTPPKTVPEPPKPAPAKKTASADDEEDAGEDDRDWAAETGPRVPSTNRTDPGDQDWAKESDDENPPDDR